MGDYHSATLRVRVLRPGLSDVQDRLECARNDTAEQLLLGRYNIYTSATKSEKLSMI